MKLYRTRKKYVKKNVDFYDRHIFTEDLYQRPSGTERHASCFHLPLMYSVDYGSINSVQVYVLC